MAARSHVVARSRSRGKGAAFHAILGDPWVRVATGHPDDDPVAKTLARERLQSILDRTLTLTALERGALAMSANDCRTTRAPASSGWGSGP